MEYIFETAHLRVRKFEADDVRKLYEHHQEPEVGQWIPNERYESLQEAEGAVAFFADRAGKKKLPFVLAVELKETGELIGDTGINEVEGRPDEVEIGYTICKKHSGRGYATELLGAMTEFVGATFGFHVIYGRVMRGNDASVRVLEKNGYVFVREEYGAEDDPYGKGMLIYKKDAES